jgi:hypothetical protein
MNATPAAKAAAQATVRDTQANEARISGVPFFFRANVVGNHHRHLSLMRFPCQTRSIAKIFFRPESSTGVFPMHFIQKNLVKKGFSGFLPTFPAHHFREEDRQASQ